MRLPAAPPAGVETVLDFFVGRFPRVAARVWQERFAGGKVWAAEGPLDPFTAFRPLLEVHYRREADPEPPVRTDYRVVWQDPHLLVVDKPPFLPVTPAGRYVRHCLLHLLEVKFGEPDLAPLHRLDHLTSGLVVLSRDPASRGHFSRLFQGTGPRAQKGYAAVCEVLAGEPPARTTLEHHLARSQTAYWRQEVVPGRPPNARLELELVARLDRLALLRVSPATGRKHQIRVQLAAVGLPVLGDPLYGPEPWHDPEDLEHRLWLDACSLTVRAFPGFASGAPLDAEWRSSCQPLELLGAAGQPRGPAENPLAAANREQGAICCVGSP